MRSSTKRNLSLVALVAALVAAGAYLPLAWQERRAPQQDHAATAGPAQEPPEAPIAAAPPGTEVVPPEESESDRGPTSASPAGPTLSFARAAGLHLSPDPLRLNSSAALVIDGDSGEVLVRKNDQAVLPIASLTKLMTTLLVAEAKQPLDEVLTITEEDVDTVRHSRSRLKVGTQLTREEALHLALMSSENRAAHALGRAYPGGLDKLVQDMNAKSRQLGMKNTSFVDPTGLSNRNQSTARDLAILVRVAGQHPLLREFSTDRAHLANLGGRTMQYVNSNRLVRNASSGWDIELQKTGYIVEAGRCLTMLTRVAGHDLVMVLLDAESNGTRLSDAQRLRRWVVAQNGWQDNLARAEEPVHKVAVAKKKGKAERPDKQQVARKEKSDRAGKHQVAAKKKGVAEERTARKAGGKNKDAVASAGKKPADRKQAGDSGKRRVKQTFAAAKGDQKS